MILPFLTHVFAVDEKFKAWLVGSVETCSTDDNVHFDLVAMRIKEAFGRDLLELAIVNGHLLTFECFEVAVARCRAAAPNKEVRGHDVFDQVWTVGEDAFHFILGERLGFLLGWGAIDDKAKALVEFTFDHFAVGEVGIRVRAEEFELLRRVFEVGAIGSGECLSETCSDPDLVADPVIDLAGGLIDVGQDLDSRGAGTDEGDALALERDILAPLSGV